MSRFIQTLEDEIEDLEARLDEANAEYEKLREWRREGLDVNPEDFQWVQNEIEECEEALAELRGDNG